MSAAISAAAIVGGGMIAGGVMQANAAKDAANSQIGALKKAPKLNIPQISDAATERDLQKYKDQFKYQSEIDPASAALRTEGAQSVLNELRAGSPASDKAFSALQEQAATEQAQNAPLIAQLIEQARAEIAAGATLPPEFQSELIRSGLENSSAAGNSLNKAGAAGANLRTLLGSAGEQLKGVRQQRAAQAIGTATDLQSRRASILAGIATMDQTLRGNRFNLGVQANVIGNNNVPDLGISGADVANLHIAKTNAAANTSAQIGQLQGQKALANGQLLSSIVQGTTSMAGGALSSYFAKPAVTTPATKPDYSSTWSQGVMH